MQHNLGSINNEGGNIIGEEVCWRCNTMHGPQDLLLQHPVIHGEMLGGLGDFQFN